VEGQASALQEARAELGGSGGGPPEDDQTLIVARVRRWF
jgi:hypothetical protein